MQVNFQFDYGDVDVDCITFTFGCCLGKASKKEMIFITLLGMTPPQKVAVFACWQRKTLVGTPGGLEGVWGGGYYT